MENMFRIGTEQIDKYGYTHKCFSGSPGNIKSFYKSFANSGFSFTKNSLFIKVLSRHNKIRGGLRDKKK